MPTPTKNYALTKPIVASELNTWGATNNGMIDAVDDILFRHGIQVFNTAAARDAAFPAPFAHQRIQRSDTGFFERFDPTALTWFPEALTRSAGPVVQPISLGAKADSVTDDAAKIHLADLAVGASGGIIDFTPGIYFIATNLIITNQCHFHKGAKLKFGVGVMVSFLAGVFTDGDNYQIFDRSMGGYDDWVGNLIQKRFPVGWWGAAPSATGANNALGVNWTIDACFGRMLLGLARSASTVGTATFAGVQWTPGAWVDALLEVTAGTGVGSQRKITASTGTQLTWDTTPDPANPNPVKGNLVLDGTSVIRLNGRNAITHAERNRILNFELGNYSVAGTISAVCIVGGHVTGSMNFGTTLTETLLNTTLFDGDAFVHSRLSYLNFTSSASQDIQHPLVTFDWTGKFQNTLKTQGVIVDHCYVNGGYNWNTGTGALTGFQIARHGSSADNGFGVFNQGTQGDTIKFHLTYFQSCGFAGCAIGSGPLDIIPDGRAFNALGIVFDTCVIQDCLRYGVYSNGAQWFWIYGSIQNQGGQSAPANLQVSLGGGDFWCDTPPAGSPCRILDLRSESYKVLGGNTSCIIDNTQIFAGSAISWVTNAVVGIGQVYRGNWQPGVPPYTPGKQDGRMWWAHSVTGDAKTDAATEPNWLASTPPLFRAGVSIPAGSNVITASNNGSYAFNNGLHTGFACVLYGAGVAGAPLFGYFKFTDADHGTLFSDQALTLPLNATTTTSNLYIVIGQGGVNGLVVDNHVNWLPMEYDAIQGAQSMTNLSMDGGRIAGTTGNSTALPITITGTTSRPDWFRSGPAGNIGFAFQQGGSRDYTYNINGWDMEVGIGAFSVPRTLGSTISPLPGLSGDYPAPWSHAIFKPQIHYGMGGGAAMVPIGWDKCIGDQNGNNVIRRAFGIINAPVAPAPFPNTATWNKLFGNSIDKNGLDQWYAGGPGSGAGTPGKSIIATSAVGSAGTTTQDFIARAQADALGRWQTLFGSAKSAVSGTINITNAGNATPSPNGAECYRYNLQGATATVNNPTDPMLDGQGFEIEFLNSSGGNSTVTFGTQYLIGATATLVANGKWMTFRFRWDATLSKFKLANANGI